MSCIVLSGYLYYIYTEPQGLAGSSRHRPFTDAKIRDQNEAMAAETELDGGLYKRVSTNPTMSWIDDVYIVGLNCRAEDPRSVELWFWCFCTRYRDTNLYQLRKKVRNKLECQIRIINSTSVRLVNIGLNHIRMISSTASKSSPKMHRPMKSWSTESCLQETAQHIPYPSQINHITAHPTKRNYCMYKVSLDDTFSAGEVGSCHEISNWSTRGLGHHQKERSGE
jgi:hypothetical protein